MVAQGRRFQPTDQSRALVREIVERTARTVEHPAVRQALLRRIERTEEQAKRPDR